MTESPEKNNDIDTIIKAFHMNWDLHPFPVMLIKADRTILAVNKPGQKLGIPTDMKCFQLNKLDKVCPYCQANKAIKENKGIQLGGYQAARKQFTETFWVPIDGADGIYLHYGNDITQWAKDELMTEPESSKE